MPYKPKKPCKYQGCPNLTHDYYCDKHNGLYIRESSGKRGYDGKWRKIRKLFLKTNPLCDICKNENKLTEASEVHHIVPLSSGGTNDFNNLQALCKSCHSKITQGYVKKYQY